MKEKRILLFVMLTIATMAVWAQSGIAIYQKNGKVARFTFSEKPVVKTVNVETLLTAAGVTPATGDMVGAFIGDECRGKVTLSASGITILDIYGRSAGESVTLKYYHAAKGVLYTIPNAVKM